MKRKHRSADLLRRAVLNCIVAALVIFLVSPAAHAAQTPEGVDFASSLLVVSFVLCICILAVSGFSLWQSHRYYLDTVRLSREITATTTELHHKIIELIFSLKSLLAHESERVPEGESPDAGETVSEEVAGSLGDIAGNISETEEKIRGLEKTLQKLNDQISFDSRPEGISQKISALSDIEYAVLFKLSQDPRFFEHQSFSSFGASPKILDSLLSRQLIIFDRDGKAKVPGEVATAIRRSAPEN
jgi:hypothetical protein